MEKCGKVCWGVGNVKVVGGCGKVLAVGKGVGKYVGMWRR